MDTVQSSRIKSIRDLDVQGKRVLVRLDLNVPLGPEGQISDDTRIDAALPTIRSLMASGARVILASHLGRPKGQVNPKYSLSVVAKTLEEKLKHEVMFLDDCIGDRIKASVMSLSNSDVCLLENLRFRSEEEANEEEFASSLAELAEIYINDAFGTAHRAHASTAGVTAKIAQCAAGLLMTKELDYLGQKVNNPQKPLVVILGGAKVSDKIKVIDALLDKADSMIIGGAMAYTFAAALGLDVGDSLVELDKKDIALAAINKAKQKGVQLLLPIDHLVTDHLDFASGKLGESKIVEGNIPAGWQGVDIGPKSIELYSQAISSAKTVLWNGPMGIFEIEASAAGTFAVAKAVASSDSTSIIGGGDSVKAIKQSGYASQVTFMSTGGGASLEFLEGKELPGVTALDRVGC